MVFCERVGSAVRRVRKGEFNNAPRALTRRRGEVREARIVMGVAVVVRSLDRERATRLVVVVVVVIRLAVEVVVDAAALVVVRARVLREVERGKDDRAGQPEKRRERSAGARPERPDDHHPFEESYRRGGCAESGPRRDAAAGAMPPSICRASSAYST